MKKIFGLIGERLGHSFSQRFFTDKFAADNIDAEYRNFELPDVGDLMELIAEYPELSGLNVTIPYKESVIPYMDALDPVAREIGAVNVIKIDHTHDGDVRLTGFNTDAVGFMESVRPSLGMDHSAALVLGTGGASKAVVYALKQLDLEVTRVSRSAGTGVLTYADLTPDLMAAHTVIVNATPLGTYPDVDSCPDIPYDILSTGHLCVDLVYNPAVTEFMRRSAANGATVKNGLGMLINQALESWKIWNDLQS